MAFAITDIRSFWNQSKALTAASLKCRYRKTWAGFLWVVLNPLVSFAVQAVAFRQFLKIDVQHYLVFLVSGLLPWSFIVQTLEMSSTVFVNAGPLIKSILVSPMVFLLAQVLDNLLNFFAAFLIILVIVFAIDGGDAGHLWLLPIPLLSLVIGVFALAWNLATIHIFFRDTRFLVSFGLQVCFFLTPIFYPREFIPIEWRWITSVNIFFLLIQPFQILIHDFTWQSFLGSLMASFVTSFGLLLLAKSVWRTRKASVYLHV